MDKSYSTPSNQSVHICHEPRSLLLELVGLSGGLGQDPPLGDEDDVLAGKLLLELSHKSGLNLLEGRQLRNLKQRGNANLRTFLVR